MDITVLISCYKGNHNKIINYCKQYGLKTFVLYNKLNDKFGIPVKNVGVDTYDKLHYIINNYDNLPDIILFTTDSILNDSSKKRWKLKYILQNLNLLQKQSGFITGHILKLSETEQNFKLSTYKHKTLIQSQIRPFSQWFAKFIDSSDINQFYMSKKGVFAVTKDLIYEHSKDYYSTLLHEVEKFSQHGHDSEVPHYLERSWVSIFCHNNIEKMFHDVDRYGVL